MPDYAAEQEEEIEALQAILMEDIEEVDSAGPEGLCTEARCFQIAVRPEGDDADASAVESEMRMSLTFAHTPKYPDEAPLFRVRSVRGVSKAEVAELQQLLEAQASENLGMAMLFTLATSAREWLRGKAHFVSPCDQVDPAVAKAQAEEEEEARKAAARLAGTPVTPESYAAWWARFQAEVVPQQELQADAERARRLTGRRFFELRAEKGRGEGDEEEEELEEGSDEEEQEQDDDEDFDPDAVGSDDEAEVVESCAAKSRA